MGVWEDSLFLCLFFMFFRVNVKTEERTKFNEYVDKIQRHSPYVEKLLPLIDFCRNTLKFSERVIQELCMLKKVRLKGDFCSPEFN